MIHTAEEILEILTRLGHPTHEMIKHAIREAQKEAIKECAEVAKPGTNACQVWNCESESSVDKQSILKLLDQIK